jgi:hypothetical protein
MRSFMRGMILIVALLVPARAALAQASIEGIIRFDGPPPAAPAHPVTRDHDVCGQHKPNETILVSNGGLANVVISIEGAPKGAFQPREVVVANENCRFAPHVSAATVGSTLIVQNRDKLLHNTHVYLSDQSTFFNVAFAVQNTQIKRPLPKPDVMTFKCDVGHVWMSAYVHVFAHPYFAVSDASGRFRIDGLPPGTYTITAWHEELGTHSRRIDVVGGANKAGFVFKK